MAQLTRRGLLKRCIALGSGLAVGNLAAGLYAAGNDTIRVGLIGCGGRGASAAAQALATGPDVRLTAMADVFPEQIENARSVINKRGAVRNQVQVDQDHEFVGLDAYKRLLESGVNVVLLTTPPAFRPLHFDAAVSSGAHVFMEKPVAVDASGARSLLETSKRAAARSLKVAVGLHHRHDQKYRETVQRLKDGAIGKIESMTADWRTASVWEPRVGRADVRSELELQIRNWVYFVWLSGEVNLEQNIHNVDVCNWIMGTHPISAEGACGRTVRVGSKYGDVHDEFEIKYTYADGTQLSAHARHHPRPPQGAADWIYVGETVQASGGTAELKTGTINANGSRWRFKRRKGNAHQLEQTKLFAAIREGRAYNEVDSAVESQRTIIMGRMAAYSGEPVKWEDVCDSNERFVPDSLSLAGVAPTMPDKFGDYLVPAQPRTTDA